MLTDIELRKLKTFGSHGMVLNASGWAMVFRIVCGRPVTTEEASDAISRIHAEQPRDPDAITIGDIERSTEPAWRNPHCRV